MNLGLLLLIEAVPLVGVLLLGWDVALLMLLFWAENVIAGAWQLPRLMLVRAAGVGIGRLFVAAFFTVHFGLFCFVHLVFVVNLFGAADSHGPGLGAAAAAETLGSDAGWAVLALAIGYGIEFVRWLGRGRDAASVGRQIGTLYARVVMLHVTLIAGGFLMLAFGAPRLALAVLIAVKAAFDIRASRYGLASNHGS